MRFAIQPVAAGCPVNADARMNLRRSWKIERGLGGALPGMERPLGEFRVACRTTGGLGDLSGARLDPVTEILGSERSRRNNQPEDWFHGLRVASSSSRSASRRRWVS